VLRALDQTRLPAVEVELELADGTAVAQAIQRLAIRGAPLIGVAAAYGLAIEVAGQPTADHARVAAATLRSARPTAVNLSYAVDRVLDAALAASPGELAAASLAEARRIHEDELAASAAMARHGADFLGSGVRRILTHCNTGTLAAPGHGTALGVIGELHARGSLTGVLTTESRPLLQGARLTVWELSRLGIPHELCVDSAAAGLLAGGAADAVILGCDRVAANGDVANKVGTYMLALAARAAGIPFVVAGPCSTIDPDCPDGDSIVIEERDPEEVRAVRTQLITLPDTSVRNPAFDVTPASLISALVTERGVVSPVDGAGIRKLLARA
jgi:methylthioribose-1-phosphate isomerase